MKRLLLLLPLAAFSQTPPPKAPVVPTDLNPQIETLQPGVKMTLLAEHPDLVTPTGIDVDEKGRIWLAASHTHHRPEGYDGPQHDEILVFDADGKNRRVFYNKTDATMHVECGPEGWIYLAERDRILRVKDSDGDGILDKNDKCPDKAGPTENGGCPDEDIVKDGIINRLDKCPTIPGPKENDGCPDTDTDKDGLVDRLDKCPKEPGPKENQGCPDTDRDGDGLVDRLDSCPDQPGPLENNGCPLLDTDKDGIPDKDDKCPYEPGPKENNGCPPPRKYINVTQEKIELLQKIMFATNKADIKPASFDLLNEVVSVMKSRPTMRVHIEGHTDIRGTLQWNMKLSKMRAESVQKYLIDHGTEPERMAPLRIAELCEKAFAGTSVSVKVERDVSAYPLLSAVARASQVVERHRPCVVELDYRPAGEIQRTVILAGKGVTYDTGGADLKTDGHMAGMSRDKGGAGVVVRACSQNVRAAARSPAPCAARPA